VVNAMVTQADGYAEREAAKAMLADTRQVKPQGEITLGAETTPMRQRYCQSRSLFQQPASQRRRSLTSR
jgi:hypothetical protein